MPFARCRSIAISLALAILITSLIACSAAQPTDPDPTGPGTYHFSDDKRTTSFPFEIYHGDIRYAAEINGHPVKLLLDDGFMWDEILFWGNPEVKTLDLDIDGTTLVGDEGDENAIESTTASGITVALPGIEFRDQTAVLTPTDSGTGAMWEGSIGQLSGTFLKNLVVEINFDTMQITLTDPGFFSYTGNGVALPWQPLEVGAWSIPGTLVLHDGRTVSLEFMMDLGYNDQLQIATHSEHGIAVPGKALAGTLGFNIQREATRGHYARVARANIGGYEVSDVLASFVAEDQGDHTFHEVMIGLGLLSRFNLTFDYPRQTLYVEPNSSFNDPFERNMSGLSLSLPRGGALEILKVHPDSPGADVGIQPGDRVVTINGKAAVDYSYWDLQPLLKQPGETVEMTILRGTEEFAVTFVLRRVI